MYSICLIIVVFLDLHRFQVAVAEISWDVVVLPWETQKKHLGPADLIPWNIAAASACGMLVRQCRSGPIENSTFTYARVNLKPLVPSGND